MRTTAITTKGAATSRTRITGDTCLAGFLTAVPAATKIPRRALGAKSWFGAAGVVGRGPPPAPVPTEDAVRGGGERQDDRDRHRREGLPRGLVDGVVLVGIRVVV